MWVITTNNIQQPPYFHHLMRVVLKMFLYHNQTPYFNNHVFSMLLCHGVGMVLPLCPSWTTENHFRAPLCTHRYWSCLQNVTESGRVRQIPYLFEELPIWQVNTTIKKRHIVGNPGASIKTK